MELVLLRKGSRCFIGLVFTSFDSPTCVMNSQKRMSVILNNSTKERGICSLPMPSLIISVEVELTES